jgi:hypothetical protein
MNWITLRIDLNFKRIKYKKKKLGGAELNHGVEPEINALPYHRPTDLHPLP